MLPNEAFSTNFAVDYNTIGGGLTVDDYLESLETSWSTEVTGFGWAAPPVRPSNPPPGNRYHVRVDVLAGGLYGFVSSGGTHAGNVGDNPNTPWNDVDALASCMVLNRDYTGFPGSPQRALDATTAHELNHSIQYGYGALGGSNTPDDLFVEGGATWMEDEVYDASDDSHNYLWPAFTQSLGDYDGSPYAAWLMLRGLTERFGTNVAGGGERVLQRFWEATSQGTGNNLSALASALAPEGVTIADAYHDFAVGAAFMRPCGGGYALPTCFEEATAFIANAGGLPPVQGAIGSAGGSFSGSVEDDYAASWVTLPAGTYPLTLTNTSSGGSLRASAVCDTGTQLVRSPLPAVVGAGASTTLTTFSTAGCVRTLAVITNQQQSTGNPSSSPVRTYTLSSGGGGSLPTLAVADGTVVEGNTGTTPMTFGVTLSSSSTTTVTVAYATSTSKGIGKATAGADYLSTSGTLTFAPGETAKTITVSVVGDTAQELDETFLVTLASPSGATLADAQATGLIDDDDSGGGGPVTVSIADASGTEGNKATRSLSLLVSLSAPAAAPVTVTATTSDGTATAPADYTARSATVTIPAGSTSQAFIVTVRGDMVAEPNETFVVTLSAPSGATIADGTATATIVNDD